ncbi:ABC transporter substrate-binding protein [Paenibacillus sp. MMS18-CY102]|uniref:ABC transporter substrate-binding protein n=1 Tax=Paenibacillus sp. MMS18-CY102 TaxID=2682849 RepID=UPI0013662159|nr:extracellular solute-binding protein [Paenibacillus sp. MMS18-CY102]MWC30606.1 extracellular solute-binding protein [Paenibacillus sp. MMS18-CY102]
MAKKFIVLLAFISMILMSCSNRAEQSDKPVTLKVLGTSEMLFNEQYGNVFVATHPNYSIEFISASDPILNGEDPLSAYSRLMDQQKPDVVILSNNMYTYLTGKGKLVSLNDYINNDEYNLSDVTPAVLSFLKNDAGELYGLTPTFTGTGLYYNKKLFKEYGVPAPTNGMTWDELFVLAQRFPTSNNGEKQFGYYSYDAYNPFLMALHVGQSKGLSLYNGKSFTFETESWKHIIEQVADCFKQQICFDRSTAKSAATTNREEMEKRSYPFLQGNIALAMDSSDLYSLLIMNKDRYADLDWGLVTMPGSEETQGAGTNINLTDIVSIPSDASEKEGAWTFINYVAGDQYARLLPRVNPGHLPVRLGPEGAQGEASAFYAFDRINDGLFDSLRELPMAVISKLDEIGPANFNDILSNKMTVDDAIKQMQNEMQAELNIAKPNQ